MKLGMFSLDPAVMQVTGAAAHPSKVPMDDRKRMNCMQVNIWKLGFGDIILTIGKSRRDIT